MFGSNQNHTDVSELNKESIINTAGDLFLKEGVKLVSIDDICKKLGISKKTFYQFYSQKEELIMDFMVKKSESNQNKLREMVEGKDAVELFVALSAEFSKKKVLTSMKRVYSEICKYYPETARKLSVDKDEVVRRMFEYSISNGIEQGYVRSELDIAASSVLVVAMHHGMLAYCEDSYPAKGKKVPFKALTASFEDMVSRMIFTQKGIDHYNEIKNKQ
jgi:Transcriptional regulator